MNVIKICIEVRNKDQKAPPVKRGVITAFSEKARSSLASFQEDCKNNWRSQKINLKSLYPLENLVVCRNRAGIVYFLFDPTLIGGTDADIKTFEVLIIADSGIDYAVNTVASDIMLVLAKNKVSLLKENNVLLYPYDITQADIYDPNNRIIQATYRHKIICSKAELSRFIIILFLSILFSVLHRYGKFETDANAVFISLYCSGYFFLATELLIKLAPLLGKQVSISIENLSDFIRHNPRVPFAEANEGNLENPPEDHHA